MLEQSSAQKHIQALTMHHPAYQEAGLISILSAINQSLFCLGLAAVPPFSLFALDCVILSYI